LRHRYHYVSGLLSSFLTSWLFLGALTFELTGFYGAQRSKNPVQRFVSPSFHFDIF
jgi:hypothetical protein